MPEQLQTRTPGPGVKPNDGALTLGRKQVLLDPESLAILSTVGGGILSLGLREAARRLVEHTDTEPFTVQRHESRLKEKSKLEDAQCQALK